ncbi:MAG: hypothetical protein AAF585_18865 [Verrucomicrobiota bacterium]
MSLSTNPNVRFDYANTSFDYLVEETQHGSLHCAPDYPEGSLQVVGFPSGLAVVILNGWILPLTPGGTRQFKSKDLQIVLLNELGRWLIAVGARKYRLHPQGEFHVSGLAGMPVLDNPAFGNRTKFLATVGVLGRLDAEARLGELNPETIFEEAETARLIAERRSRIAGRFFKWAAFLALLGLAVMLGTDSPEETFGGMVNAAEYPEGPFGIDGRTYHILFYFVSAAGLVIAGGFWLGPEKPGKRKPKRHSRRARRPQTAS